MRAIVLVSLALLLAACSGGGGLRDMSSTSGGPDEFSVTPTAPLTLPENLELPAPTPGGANLTDVNPNANAIAALGGRPSAVSAGGIPARDGALVSHASRNGVDPSIRSILFAEDESFRKRAGFRNFFNIFGRDKYFPAYARQSLDAYSELERFRAAGIATPSAPPR